MSNLATVVSVGDVLPNGATVLDVVCDELASFDDEGTYRYGYVLAMRGRKFVTWRLGVRPSGELVTLAGHYYPTITQAVADFSARSAVSLADYARFREAL